MTTARAMTTEWLDVVDAANRVVGRSPRYVVHREGLLHRAVHMLLLDSAGRVFVQRRAPGKDTNPDLWDTSAAGHVDSGEPVHEAARRELSEELGIQVGLDELIRTGQLPPDVSNGNEFVEIYRVVSDQPLTLQASEIAEGRWVSAAALDDWLARAPADFTGIFPAVWENARPAGR